MKNVARKLRPFLKIKGIEDIIIFGSKSKGKIAPNDIDIAIISGSESQDVKKRIKEIIPNADIQVVGIKDMHKSIFLTLIKEGYSLKKDSYIHNLYNLSPVKLYKYDLKQLTQSKKVMFERGIKTIKGITRLSNSVVLVPIENSAEFEEFLKNWNLDIDTKEYELIPMMRKEEVI